jgi:hypothetical protein
MSQLKGQNIKPAQNPGSPTLILWKKVTRFPTILFSHWNTICTDAEINWDHDPNILVDMDLQSSGGGLTR